MKNIILICVCTCIVLVGLFIFIDRQSTFHRQLLKHEATFRADVLQRIKILHQQRDSLDAIIVNLKQDIKDQTSELKKQINKIKIINVPKIDYSNYSDSAIVKRLLSDYPNR